MLELLSPAGSPEAVTAAVQNGANAVYLGFGEYNARRNAKNFSYEELVAAVSYCHLRDVKVYLTLNTLLSDRELTQAADLVAKANACGVDAVLVQDLGVLRMIKQVAPGMALHGSTQMSIHSLDGVRMAADLGLSRVVLARELSRKQILHICKKAPIEIEVFVHGALCMSYSGQCYMSSVIGGRSGNRGLCAQPCRMAYRWGLWDESNLLSLKDLSLAGHLQELEEMGVSCVKIEGRMKRPEYVAVVTGIYAAAIRERRDPTREELRALKNAFSRQGFTDGYYMGETGPAMFGVREEDNSAETAALFARVRAKYLKTELQRVPIRMYAAIRAGEPAQVGVEDRDGHICTAKGSVPEKAVNRPLTEENVIQQLEKTGGTPFACDRVRVYVEPGLSLPVSELNALRRTVLEQLTALRESPPARPAGTYQPGVRYENRKEQPCFTVSVSKLEQVTEELLSLSPELVYIPLSELSANRERASALAARHGKKLAISLPRIIGDGELKELAQMLFFARDLGIAQALAGNLGQIAILQMAGFNVRGDYGLNIFNSQALKELKRLNVQSATVSFELRMSAIRDLSKCMDIEMIGYGRLPLMITENCIIKNRTGLCNCENANAITDRTGVQFPVVRAEGCRNVIYNSKKLFLADKSKDWKNIGLWALRLQYTTENPRECVQVLERYLDRGPYEPNDYTRGLYYREVE